MAEKENKFKGLPPTQTSMLQFTLNQALNKRESFLSGATMTKFDKSSFVGNNLSSNYGQRRMANKSNVPSRTE